jgi:hypothetical protein
MFESMVGEELTELLMKPLTGTKTADNTKITHFSQYFSIDTVFFCDLKLKVYWVGNDGEFVIFG